MPVPRLHGRDDRVDYVVVRRTGKDGEEEVDDVALAPTPTLPAILGRSNAKQQFQRRDGDDDDDDDDDRGPPPPVRTLDGLGNAAANPPQILATITLSQTQATGGTALADNDPTETVVVSISPPPKPPHPQGHKGGISQTTEHLLIAAGSIGATIIVVMIILAIYTMRKRGLTLAEAVKHGKYQVTRRGPPPPPPKRYQSYLDSKNDYGSLRNDTITPPQAAVARSGSISSQRPLMALDRSDSFNLNRQPSYRTQRSASPGQAKSFLLESPPPPRRNNSHRRDDSTTPSSPVLGQQSLRRSASTRNTRSIEDDASELRYPDPIQEQERALSPLPPPPTFKQFLFNRPSISGKPGPGGGMISRFSWTNSQAPQTPHDPYRDTNSHQIGRDSFMTQRSSIPRFRTVDSWVNQQTNRLEEQKLKEQFRLTQTSTIYSGDDERDHIPEVPAMPKNVQALRENSTPLSSSLPSRMPLTPPTPPSGGLPGKNIKHERHDTRTTVETAPIFRQHPGTEVRFSTRSAVPSEILDRGRNPNVLS